MPTSILGPKLYIPLPRPGFVPRPRLVERLNEELQSGCKLILISASAGFGKTTLLGEWIGHLGKPVAWLSLEKEDNDPGRFWAYVLAAIRTIQPDLGDDIIDLQFSSPQSHTDAVLTPLVNKISAFPDPIVLILDDYHVIDSSSIQEGMIFLLDHIPAQLHLVIAGRADPPWPLARWRTLGQLMEIRAADLRFTPEETDDFLRRTMKLDLSIQEIAALEERTEGWIAGLQMAALSLQGRENVREFIDAFAGSNRYIFDYLIEEVFARQPAEVQDFLLKTSILVHLSAPLCDAMLKRTDSRKMLHELEKANLFLIPLDDERQWYRYHHLFRDLLGRRLEQTEHDHIAELHRRASQWYAANNFLSEAIHHALDARDFPLVNELVSGNALAIVEHSELFDVLRQFERIPDDQLLLKPWLCVAYAWVKAHADPTAGLDLVLQQAESCLVGLENVSQSQRLSSHLVAIRAYVAWVKGDADKALELAQKSLESVPEGDRTIRPYLLGIEGLAWQYLNKLPAAIQSFNMAITANNGTNINYDILTNSHLAFAYLLQGHLHKAYTLCRHNVDLAGKSIQSPSHIPVLAYSFCIMGIILLEWNQVESALSCARQSAALAQQWKQADALHFTLNYLSKILCAAGSMDDAFAVNDRAMRLADSISPWYFQLTACNEAWLNLVKGDARATARRLEEIEPQVREKKGTYLVIKVSLLNAQENYQEVLAAVDGPIDELEQCGEHWISVNLMLFQALALQALDREEEAIRVVRRCLALTAPEDYIRIYIEKGAPMVRLLKHAKSQGIEPEYIKRLLFAFNAPSRPRGSILPSWSQFIYRKDIGRGKREIQPPVKEYVVPLSERELEILRLLESSMNTPEIARELYISVGTVRTHIKNIYRKLEVNGRREAILRAKELGLI
jgi:LuxR family maltose regulon positive regulatory protein